MPIPELRETLFQLAKAGDHEGIIQLLDQNIDIDTQNIDGATLLHIAVAMNDLTLFNILLDRNANVNLQTDIEKWTPLLLACHSNQHNMVEILLQHKADPNLTTRHNKSALHFATDRDAIETVKILLAYNADPDVQLNDHLYSPLMLAAFYQKNEIAKLLLKHNANPHLTSREYKRTALHSGVSNRSLGMIYDLISHGADPTMKDASGNSPAMLAKSNGMHIPTIYRLIDLESIPYLVKMPYSELLHDMLDKALARQRIDILNSILDNYSTSQLKLSDKMIKKVCHFLSHDTLSAPSTKSTALDKLKNHYSMSSEEIDYTKMLIERDAKEVNKVLNITSNKEGQSCRFFKHANIIYACLIAAVNENNYDELKEVIDDNKNKNLNIKDERGTTLLEIAYIKKSIFETADEVTTTFHPKILSEEKQTTEHEEKELSTEDLKYQTQKDNSGRIFYLLWKTLDVKDKSTERRTILHTAIIQKASLSDVVLFLLKGANKDAMDLNGRTALDYCFDRHGDVYPEMEEQKEILSNGLNSLFTTDRLHLLEKVVEQLSLIKDDSIKDMIYSMLLSIAEEYDNLPLDHNKTVKAVLDKIIAKNISPPLTPKR